MGYPDLTQFDIEFIERTQRLIRTYRGKSNFTLLVNCLYTLIILTVDKARDQNIPNFQIEIVNVPELNTVINKQDFLFNPVSGNGIPQNPTLERFIIRMRHSLAHPTIQPENEVDADGKLKWKAINFSCINKYAPNNPLELRASFTSRELKAFSIAISTLYQQHILGV